MSHRSAMHHVLAHAFEHGTYACEVVHSGGANHECESTCFCAADAYAKNVWRVTRLHVVDTIATRIAPYHPKPERPP